MHRLLLAMLTACGTSGPVDPHAHVTCDTIWTANGFTDCEQACVDATTALNAMGIGCEATTTTGPLRCQKTFEFEGAVGCCASRTPSVLFAACI